jgi:hypothetical protein
VKNQDQQAEIADLIVERIVQRTEQGKNVDGKSFPKYSKAYTESLDFKNSGKSGSVDLTLSGDMLAALTVLKTSEKYVEIGFSDSSVEGRAEGNIRGTYGKKRGNPALARDFLGTSGFTSNKGVSERELSRIVRLVKRGDT